MPRIYFAFALTLFAACAAAIYAFTRELTRNKPAALYAAATYVAIPMVNGNCSPGT